MSDWNVGDAIRPPVARRLSCDCKRQGCGRINSPQTDSYKWQSASGRGESREAEQVVRDLARRTGLSITEAVHQAAVEKLRRMDEDREQRRKALYEIIERSKSLPILDSRSEDEILGYNDKGTFD